MINGVNYSAPSFGSTRLPIDDTDLRKYLKPLNDYFEVKGFMGNKTAQEYADQIDFGKAAFVITEKEAMIVGKDGGEGGADRFIYKILKKNQPRS